MFRIGNRQAQGVKEYLGCLLERDSMLKEICSVLRLISFERQHPGNLQRLCLKRVHQNWSVMNGNGYFSRFKIRAQVRFVPHVPSYALMCHQGIPRFLPRRYPTYLLET